MQHQILTKEINESSMKFDFSN